MRYEITNTSTWSFNSGTCGGNFTTSSGRLTSPSYPGPYPNSEDCIYTISQLEGTHINIKFISMDIEKHSACGYDYLDIRDGNSEESSLMEKLCGNEIPDPIQSTENHVWMR